MGINFIQRTFSSLRHENYKLYFIGQSISLVGTWMQQTAMSWLIYDLTGSRLLLGLIAALGSLPILFLSIFGGVIADRYPKRKIMIATQVFTMLFSLILSVLVFTKTIQIWHIIVLAACAGIVFAIDMPVRNSFTIEIVGKKDLMNAIALNSTMFNLARIIGPAAAGLVMMQFGIAWCFIFNALSFIAIIVALIKLKLPEIKIKRKVESMLQFTIDGFNYVKNNRMIFNLITLMIVVGIFGWAYTILFPAIAKDMFSQGENGYAMMVSANGVGSLIGALFIAYWGDNPGKRKLVNAGVYLAGIMIILLALCHNYWLSLFLIAGAGMGLVLYFSSSSTLIQSSVDDAIRGRVIGIWSLAFGGTTPLSQIFAGASAQYIGLTETLIISAVICVLFTIIIYMFAQPSEQEEPVEDTVNAQ